MKYGSATAYYVEGEPYCGEQKKHMENNAYRIVCRSNRWEPIYKKYDIDVSSYL